MYIKKSKKMSGGRSKNKSSKTYWSERLNDMLFSRPCKKSDKKKYIKRPSPPIPASTCRLGTIKKGNDGYDYKIVKAGKSRRWIKIIK